MKFDRFSCSSNQAARYHLGCYFKERKNYFAQCVVVVRVINIDFPCHAAVSNSLVGNKLLYSCFKHMYIHCRTLFLFFSINVSIYQTHLEKKKNLISGNERFILLRFLLFILCSLFPLNNNNKKSAQTSKKNTQTGGNGRRIKWKIHKIQSKKKQRIDDRNAQITHEQF